MSEIPVELVRKNFETNVFSALDLTQRVVRNWVRTPLRKLNRTTQQNEETNSCPGLTSTTGIDRTAGCPTNHPSADQALR